MEIDDAEPLWCLTIYRNWAFVLAPAQAQLSRELNLPDGCLSNTVKALIVSIQTKAQYMISEGAINPTEAASAALSIYTHIM